MLSLLGSPPPSKSVLVIGGNVNGTMRAWLQQVGVSDFMHAATNVRSIDPQNLKISADYIRREYGTADFLITVGLFADKVVKLAKLDHGTLPATNIKDRKIIAASLAGCQDYLMRRRFYAPSQPFVDDPFHGG